MSVTVYTPTGGAQAFQGVHAFANGSFLFLTTAILTGLALRTVKESRPIYKHSALPVNVPALTMGCEAGSGDHLSFAIPPKGR